MTEPTIGAPTHVLRNMLDHALSRRNEWEETRADRLAALVSASNMVTHWTEQARDLGLELEKRGDFDDEQR